MVKLASRSLPGISSAVFLNSISLLALSLSLALISSQTKLRSEGRGERMWDRLF